MTKKQEKRKRKRRRPAYEYGVKQHGVLGHRLVRGLHLQECQRAKSSVDISVNGVSTQTQLVSADVHLDGDPTHDTGLGGPCLTSLHRNNAVSGQAVAQAGMQAGRGTESPALDRGSPMPPEKAFPGHRWQRYVRDASASDGLCHRVEARVCNACPPL